MHILDDLDVGYFGDGHVLRILLYSGHSRAFSVGGRGDKVFGPDGACLLLAPAKEIRYLLGGNTKLYA